VNIGTSNWVSTLNRSKLDHSQGDKLFSKIWAAGIIDSLEANDYSKKYQNCVNETAHISAIKKNTENLEVTAFWASQISQKYSKKENVDFFAEVQYHVNKNKERITLLRKNIDVCAHNARVRVRNEEIDRANALIRERNALSSQIPSYSRSTYSPSSNKSPQRGCTTTKKFGSRYDETTTVCY